MKKNIRRGIAVLSVAAMLSGVGVGTVGVIGDVGSMQVSAASNSSTTKILPHYGSSYQVEVGNKTSNYPILSFTNTMLKSDVALANSLPFNCTNSYVVTVDSSSVKMLSSSNISVATVSVGTRSGGGKVYILNIKNWGTTKLTVKLYDGTVKAFNFIVPGDLGKASGYAKDYFMNGRSNRTFHENDSTSRLMSTLNLSKIKLDGKTLTRGKDFDVLLKFDPNNMGCLIGDNCWRVNVTIKPKTPEYVGELKLFYRIREIELSKASVVTKTSAKYNGKAQCPTVTVKIGNYTVPVDKFNEDYNVKYSNNVKPGTAVVIVTPKNNRSTGSARGEFRVIGKVSSVKLNNKSAKYVKNGIAKVGVKVYGNDGKLLKQGTDYKLTYGSNNKVGTNTGSVHITGIGNYTGSKTVYFNIVK